MNENLLDAASDLDTVDPNKNYLTELVGDGKKFKTQEELARGKYESDLYIKTLTRQLEDMRADVTRFREESVARARLEELVDQLSSKQLTSSAEQPLAKEDSKPEYNIDEVVSNKIREIEAQRKEQQNFNDVKNKLKERFGDNYPNVLKQQIDNLGLTQEFVNDLARKHPAVLYKTLGLDQT